MFGLLTPISNLLTMPVAALLCLGAYKMSQSAGGVPSFPDESEEQDISEDHLKSPESVMSLLDVDPIEFEFGYGLIPLADLNQGGDLLDRIVMIRRQLAIEAGDGHSCC